MCATFFDAFLKLSFLFKSDNTTQYAYISRNNQCFLKKNELKYAFF